MVNQSPTKEVKIYTGVMNNSLFGANFIFFILSHLYDCYMDMPCHASHCPFQYQSWIIQVLNYRIFYRIALSLAKKKWLPYICRCMYIIHKHREKTGRLKNKQWFLLSSEIVGDYYICLCAFGLFHILHNKCRLLFSVKKHTHTQTLKYN